MSTSATRPSRAITPREVAAPACHGRRSYFVAGFTVVELIFTLLIASVICGVLVPGIWRAGARLRLDLACAEVTTALRAAQYQSFKYSDHVGLKFWTAERPMRWGVYIDGDDDGVRTDDIRSEVDEAVRLSGPTRHLGGAIWFGFPEGLRPRDPSDPGRRLDRLSDPIRFGRSDIAAFSHLGTSSPGTLYLTNGFDLAAVRINNRSGRVRIMHYDRREEVWR